MQLQGRCSVTDVPILHDEPDNMLGFSGLGPPSGPCGVSAQPTPLLTANIAAICHGCYRSMVAPDTNKYFVTIEPGVDAAFVVALATLCDEMFHDQ